MGAKKLEPIDWHEFANDAVLNGNMSTLYQRPVSEDPSAYASVEALREIEKRSPKLTVDHEPTVGSGPTVGISNAIQEERVSAGVEPTVGLKPTVGTDHRSETPSGPQSLSIPTVGPSHTVGMMPTVGLVNSEKPKPRPMATEARTKPTVGIKPTVGMSGTVGAEPTVGLTSRVKVKPIRDVQDALTLAGHVLYKAMYGAPDGAKSKTCVKGYRQLAAETHLDKDTVRDLISEFKEKGIVRETRTYDPDTRSAKTYEVLSYKAILQVWRDANLLYVTTGRKRPVFCTPTGDPVEATPTVGIEPTVGSNGSGSFTPTVGPKPTAVETGRPTPAESTLEILAAMQQITGAPVDQEAAGRLLAYCRAEAVDCTVEEIVEVAWSKAFLCRSGKIENPVGFLITQVPKHFQPEALEAYRQKKRTELEAAAESAAREEVRRQEAERELAELREASRLRETIAERHRGGKGIDLKAVSQDPQADDTLRQWATRMMKLGHRYQPQYQ